MNDLTIAVGRVRMILVIFTLILFAFMNAHRFAYALAPIFVNAGYYVLILINEAWKKIKKYKE